MAGKRIKRKKQDFKRNRNVRK